jgi:DNA repair protein RecN (Recombination protein N)
LLTTEGLEGDDAQFITLGREIRSNGRSICRVNGRTTALQTLRSLGNLLVDIHGQAEHLSLLNPREHLVLLDRYAGLLPQRQQFADLARQVQRVRKNLHTIQQNERSAAQRSDVLNFQINEIGAAKLKNANEVPELLAERNRLANAEKLAQLAEAVLQVGADGLGEELPSVADLLAKMVQSLDKLARLDPSQSELAEQAQQLQVACQDVLATVQDYRERIEFNPKRLLQVEERLRVLEQLKRKYGDNMADILAYQQQAQAELASLSNLDEQIASLQAELYTLQQQLGQCGWALSQARHAAAERLAAGVEQQLADLSMRGARFGFAWQTQPDPSGALLPNGEMLAFDSTGIDQAEFLVAPNPGEGLKPMVKIASGGETARLMLALKGVLAQADQTPVLVFDEIDQGIGGRVGTVVGQKLWDLTNNHQVLCITHLPQLAGFGDQHLQVTKQTSAGRTATVARELVGDSRVAELAQMLGSESASTRLSANEILQMAQHYKQRA